jgi:predicted transcriptional regulator
MVFMNVTLSIDDELVKKVRKIAVDRDTTLTAMVRDYLLAVANEEAAFGRKQTEREALEKTFREIEFRMGERSWTRQDLYERS